MSGPRIEIKHPTSVEPWLQRDWDLRGTGNFVFGGTGTGLLIAAAVAAFAGVPARWLTLLALAFVALGLFCVMLKIGRPFRALNVVLNPKTSWMSREALTAGPLFVAGLAAVWWPTPWLVALAALVGVVFLYCQAMILVASKGIPAWRAPQVLPLIMATGLVEGAGAFLVAAPWLAPLARATADSAGIFVLLVGLAARIVTWRLYRRALSPGKGPDATVRTLGEAEAAVTFVGHVIPVLLVLAALLVPAVATLLLIAAGAFAMLAGWHLKFVIINRAGFNQGFAIAHSPARGGGAPGPGGKPGWSPDHGRS
jgi:phenylacetyl-CoA:acceptor oxidoreductase subunit 2